jgi:hypothetical protein
MAGIVGMFASIGDHIPVLKKEKFGEPHPEGEISRLVVTLLNRSKKV